ncbi:MAG: tetratricopeptide repeat protein [Candidatus Cloacimonetes bacterium]|nr:tetratricopeptide repeat protein [Candidatus Cloacimonadota bacterium]
MKKISLIFLVLFLPSLLMGTAIIDSLKAEIESHSGIEKVTFLIKLASEYTSSDFDEGIIYANEALSLAREIDYEIGEYRAKMILGSLNSRKGNFDFAENLLLEALQYFETTENDSLISTNFTNLGMLYRNIGNPEKALEYYQKSLQIKQELDDPHGTSSVLGGIGLVYFEHGDYEKAKQYFLEAMEFGQRSPEKKPLTHALNNLGLTYCQLGELDTALEYFLQSLEYAKKLELDFVIASIYNNMANIYYVIGNIQEAKQYTLDALQIYNNIGSKVNIARTLNNIALIAEHEQSYDEALALYERALKIRREIGNKFEIVNTLENMAHLYINKGNFTKALDINLEAYELNQELGNQWAVANSLNQIGYLYTKIGIYSTAIDMLNEAKQIELENNYLQLLKDNLLQTTSLYALINDYEQAFYNLQRYNEVKDTLDAKKNLEKLNEIMIRHEAEQKDKENILLKKDLQISSLENLRLNILFFASIIVLTFVIIFLIFRIRTNHRLKRAVTELGISKENIEQVRKQLALVNSMLRHDLTNDLIVIKTALQLFYNQKDEKLLKEAEGKCDKGLELINKLRDLENGEGEKSKLEPIDLGKMIETIALDFIDMNIRFEGECVVLADNALASVIHNIIENARVHGKAENIIITCEEYTDYTEIKIHNDGTPIPEELHERIFDKAFSYGENAHTGMGLFLVRQNISRYGGSIYVEDNDQPGVTFVINLKKAIE